MKEFKVGDRVCCEAFRDEGYYGTVVDFCNTNHFPVKVKFDSSEAFAGFTADGRYTYGDVNPVYHLKHVDDKVSEMKTLMQDEYGLKVGDKIVYLGDHDKTDDHWAFEKGEILTIMEDDGTLIPRLHNQKGIKAYFSLPGHSWERYTTGKTITQVVAYQTEDGNLFIDEKAAEAHNRRVSILTVLNRHCCGVSADCLDELVELFAKDC